MGSNSSTPTSGGKYGATTTADEVAVEFGKRAAGKTIVVTGANCGENSARSYSVSYIPRGIAITRDWFQDSDLKRLECLQPTVPL